MPTRDPELDALLATTRRLTNRAHHLSGEINSTMEELEDFVVSLESGRMISSPFYAGPERRREPR